MSDCIVSALANLIFRNKGVKVVLDVPDTMWDAPSAEITQLKKYVGVHCATRSSAVPSCFFFSSV